MMPRSLQQRPSYQQEHAPRQVPLPPAARDWRHSLPRTSTWSESGGEGNDDQMGLINISSLSSAIDAMLAVFDVLFLFCLNQSLWREDSLIPSCWLMRSFVQEIGFYSRRDASCWWPGIIPLNTRLHFWYRALEISKSIILVRVFVILFPYLLTFRFFLSHARKTRIMLRNS